MIKKGPLLWKKAKTIIPGGNQLLSKRPERFLPELWPTYYEKAKGVKVWDLDGNVFTDMSIMGVGTCPLGYADDDVNAAVKRAVDAGSMTTLNCPEEVEFSEKILSLHPWAQMVRCAKTGGEAMSVAVRIARAATGKYKVAFCGYHGWHDWYLSANLSDDSNLDGHLLPGLEPKGVPKPLLGTALPFNYNHIDQLQEIVRNNEIGAIVVETIRDTPPEDNFLQHVREIATSVGAVLIFDEITAGFRLRCGGSYESFNVEPDIVVYGKALGNGFPLTAIVGKKKFMESAQTSFISSTYWTDRLGFAAGIATLEKMQRCHVQDHMVRMGNLVGEGWKSLSKKHGLPLKVSGIAPLINFAFEDKEKQKLHTLFTQMMLEKGYLASKSFYASYAHTEEIISAYLKEADEVFGFLKKALVEGTLSAHLKGPAASADFKRLT